MFEYVSSSVSTVLIPVWWTCGVLCWGDRLTTGFADVLRQSGSALTLSNYYRTRTLKNRWFYSLHWLEFFHQYLHWQLFSFKNGFAFKNNCWMFNLSFLCRLDDKHRSATALLVLFYVKPALVLLVSQQLVMLHLRTISRFRMFSVQIDSSVHI